MPYKILRNAFISAYLKYDSVFYCNCVKINSTKNAVIIASVVTCYAEESCSKLT